MQPSRQHCICASLAAILCFVASPRTFADALTITSSPPGATVEIDGMVAGVTPYKIDYPGGFFHKTHTVFGERLQHSIVARISKAGYTPQQITLTNGPFEWDAITGKHRGSYFLLKSERFEIKLEQASSAGAEHSVEGPGREGPIRPAAAVASNEHSEEQATSDSGTVVITSEPPDADIYLDGKFIGQTPSTVHLAPGAHHMEMKLNGRTWERDLEVLKDSKLTLHAAFPVQ